MPSAASQPKPTTTRRQRILLVLFGLVLFALLLAATEGLLALLGLGDAERYADPYVGFAPGQDLFLREGDQYVTNPAKLAFFNPQRFPVEKEAGTLRVFAVGGSTTAGRPYDDRVAFARFLALELEARHPDRRVEVINAGAISYASYRVVLLMQELVRYEPDVFVVYTGHNEFLEERSYPELRRQNATWLRLQLALQRLRLFALARRAWLDRAADSGDDDAGTASPDKARLQAEVTTRLEGWTGLDAYVRDPALEEAASEHFELNLRRMVDLARDHGAEIAFVVPASNLKDFSPFKSQPADTTTPEQSARVRALLASARRLLEQGAAEDALARLDEAAALDPLYAETQFRRGRALLALGEHDAAKDAFVRAKELDVAPLRALEAMVEAVRRVAAERGAPGVDLPLLLEAESRERFGHDILGEEFFLDHVHPDIPVHARIAGVLADAFAEAGWTPPLAESAVAAETRRRALVEQVTGSLDRVDLAQRDQNLARVLGWAGKLEEAREPLLRAAAAWPDNAEIQLDLGILEQKLDHPETALAALERAAALGLASPEASFQRGVVLARLGRLDDAAARLEDALRQRPDYPEARHNLAVVERRLGRLDAAAARFEALLNERPATAETLHQLGLVRRSQGRLDDATQTLRRALDRLPAASPLEAVVRTDLAVVLGRAGRPDDALRELERALALAPGNAEALYNLGVVEAQRGRRDAARDVYRRALDADPDHAETRNNLGILLAGQGDLVGAREQLERAVALRPEWAEAQFNLGIVHDQSGHGDAALAAVARALELDPTNPRFHQAMGLLLQARGESRRSEEHLRRAAELAAAARAGERSQQTQ